MTFTIELQHANKLYAHAKAEKLSDNATSRPALSLIQCRIKGSLFTAQFINAHECAEFTCEVTDSEDGMFWLAPPTKKFNPKKDGPYIVIEDDHKGTTYITEQGKQTIWKPDFTENEFKLEGFLGKEAEARIYMDAKLLMNALSAYVDSTKKSSVKIELLRENAGIYISNRLGEKTYILPVNVNEGKW